MDFPLGINRNARVLASAVALAATFVSTNAVSGPDVTIVNVPLPVTGSVSATVSGSVNANVTNAVLPVTGTVGISGTPNVNVLSLPPVSIALPATPFYGTFTLIASGDRKAVGVTGERLAVTTLTISNFDNNYQQLFVFNPVMTGGSCGGSVVGGANPSTTLQLEPRKSVQFQFPVPRVYDLSGLGCIAAEVTTTLTGGSVVVDVVGFSVP